MNNKWMTCTTCRAIVQLNATGTCLGCQGGFNPCNKEDEYVVEETATLEKYSTMALEMEVEKQFKEEKEEMKKTKSEKKISKVMKEGKEGKLHSGSKKGPIVKDKKQMTAIALSEAKKGKK